MRNAMRAGDRARGTGAGTGSPAGRRAPVTGANRGIGYETARGPARRGAHVPAAVRHARAGEEAAARRTRETGGTDGGFLRDRKPIGW